MSFSSRIPSNLETLFLIQSNFIIPDKYKELIRSKTATTVSSGGFYIYDMMGFYSFYQEAGVLPDYQWITSSSAGSVVGLLLVTGINIYQFVVNSTRKLKTLQLARVTPYGIYSFFANGYLQDESPDKVEVIRTILEEAYGVRDMTFRELYERTGKKFFVIVSNMSRTKNIEYTSYYHSPDLSVVDAIDASSRIPYIFAPKQLTVKGVKSWYLDGALADSFPVDAYLKDCSRNALKIDVPLPNVKENFMGLTVYNSSIGGNPYISTSFIDTPPRIDLNLISVLTNDSKFRTYGQETTLTDDIREKTVVLFNSLQSSVISRLTYKEVVSSFNNGTLAAIESIKTFIQTDGKQFS